MKKTILLTLFCCALLSCATTLKTEPEETSDTLIIGQISLKARNFKVYGDATVNGDHSSNIELTFTDFSSGEEVTVTSVGSKGLFYFTSNGGSRYNLTRLYYKKTGSSNSWADLRANPSRIAFDVTPGKVLNLGKIQWTADGEKRIHKALQEKFYDDVRDIVSRDYPDSRWNSFIWEDVQPYY